VVAGRPARIPAAARINEPVHTLAMSVPAAAVARTHSSVASSARRGRVPRPPGTINTFKRGNIRPVAEGLDGHPLGAGDRTGGPGEGEDLPAVLRPLLGPTGQDLPRSDGIQLLDTVKEQYPDGRHSPALYDAKPHAP